MLPLCPDIEQRLAACHKALLAGYQGGVGRSSATKGSEREQFVTGFLKRCLPNGCRLGMGDIVDAYGNRSGQLDIVVESPYLYSIPMTDDGPRLYPVEAVAAVIEVKSNLSDQWDEVESTFKKIDPLRKTRRKTRLEQELRYYEFLVSDRGPDKGNKNALRRVEDVKAMLSSAQYEREDIPFYAVGFDGWKKISTVSQKRASLSLDGVLVLNSSLYSFTELTCVRENLRPSPMVARNFDNVQGLWYLLDMLDRHIKDTFSQIEVQDAYRSHILGKPLAKSP